MYCTYSPGSYTAAVIITKISSLQYLYNHQSTSIYTPHSYHIITSMPIYVFILLKYTYIIKIYILLEKLLKYSLILSTLCDYHLRPCTFHNITFIIGDMVLGLQSPPLPFVNFVYVCRLSSLSTYQKQSRHTHIHGVCFLSFYIVTLWSNPFNPILCGNKYTFIYLFILCTQLYVCLYHMILVMSFLYFQWNIRAHARWTRKKKIGLKLKSIKNFKKYAKF